MFVLKKEVTQEDLERFGYTLSRVAVYPTKMMKVADVVKNLVIEVCLEESLYNTWTHKDTKDSRILKLWVCRVLRLEDEKIYYEDDHTQNELIEPYIWDLIKAGLVETAQNDSN